jgi:serine/threonine protein kinase
MAKIELLTDASAFVDLLEKSGLLTPEELAEVRQSAAGQADASALARQLIKKEKLTSWQAKQLLGRYSRLTVGKYRLLGELGKGPMGRVYLAEHGTLNKRVSLKVLPARFGSQPEVLKRFLDEANRASALNHRNIIHIFDVGKEDEGRYYLAMVYVEGQDIQRLVEASGPMPASRAIDLVRQAAEGLAYAHEQGLTHGDLKPSNLIVDASGVLKILDLGLCELADCSSSGGSGEESTEAPSLASLAFRAPELLTSKRRSDVRSDLYSLGAVLYFLLTGKPPARDESDVAAALLKVGGVVPELANLCDHLLASDPQDRPESAAQVVAALELAQRAMPSAEKTADKSEPERPSPTVRSKRPLVARPLEEPSAAIGAAAEADQAVTASADSLAGFAIKTGRKRKSSPPVPSIAPPPAAPAAAAPPSSRSKRAWPIIPIAVIGGGVLVLVVMVAVVVVLLNRGGSQPVAKATTADTAPAAKADKPVETGESNPEANPETNPTAEPANATPPGAAGEKSATEKSATEKAGPAKTGDTPSNTKGTETAPAAPAPAPMPATPAPSPAATPASPAPATDTKTTKTPASEPKPAAAKTAPAPAPPAANPFAGFATVVALPALEVMGKSAPDALAPATLGPVKIEPAALCIVQLKGGDTAFKGKTKFLLEAANQGTAPRDWEFKIQSEKETPLVIATMSLKEDQLVFQWAEEATKQQAAPYLCNCLLSLSAGTGTHQVALRKPVVVEPLAAQVEKPFNESWNLESPPPGKQITVEIGPLEGGAPKHKVDPKTELEAFKDTTYLLAGNTDDALILGFKIDVSMPAKALKIAAQPQYQLTGMPKPLRYLRTTPKELTGLAGSQIEAAQFATAATKAAKNLKPELKKQAETQASQALEVAQKGMAQVEQLKELVKSLQEGGKIHFRVYFMADDAQVDLINTGKSPPPPMPPVAKK